MSIESLLSDLIDALKENTAAHSGKASADSAKDEPKESRGSSRGRASSRDKEPEKPAEKGISEDELKTKVRKFIDLPEDEKGNAEYDRRLEKVLDPVFNKAGIKELADLPAKYWDELADAIDAYEKDAGGSRRRR